MIAPCSLVEDAREILAADLIQVSDHATCCPFCSGFVSGYGWDSRPDTTVAYQGYDHYDTCPWLALPRIVAALEAAERLRRGYGQSTEQGIFARVDVWRYTDEDRDCRFSDKRYVCAGCQAYAETPQQFEHTKTCAAIALVAALHAEE